MTEVITVDELADNFEFLGDWETEDGERIDPGELLEMPELDTEKTDDESKSD